MVVESRTTLPCKGRNVLKTMKTQGVKEARILDKFLDLCDVAHSLTHHIKTLTIADVQSSVARLLDSQKVLPLSLRLGITARFAEDLCHQIVGDEGSTLPAPEVSKLMTKLMNTVVFWTRGDEKAQGWDYKQPSFNDLAAEISDLSVTMDCEVDENTLIAIKEEICICSFFLPLCPPFQYNVLNKLWATNW